jgi:hypothetical protein
VAVVVSSHSSFTPSFLFLSLLPVTPPRLVQLLLTRRKSTISFGLLRGWYRLLGSSLMCTWLQHGLYFFQVSYWEEASYLKKNRAVAGRKHFKYEVRPQIRNTVFLGILYGLIDTLPMVLLPSFSSYIE